MQLRLHSEAVLFCRKPDRSDKLTGAKLLDSLRDRLSLTNFVIELARYRLVKSQQPHKIDMTVGLILEIMQTESWAILWLQLGWRIGPPQDQIGHDFLGRHRAGEILVLLTIGIDRHPLFALGLQEAWPMPG